MSGKMALPANTIVQHVSAVKYTWRTLAAAVLALTVTQLQPDFRPDPVTQRGVLNVMGVAGPTTFLPHGATGVRGLQYELLRKFADDLHVTLVIEQAPNAEAVVRALRAGEADIGITGLTSDDPRLSPVQVSAPYLEVNQQLIQRRTDSPAQVPLDTDDARIAVGRNSAEARQLEAGHGDADIIEVRNATPEKLLERVNAGEVDYAVLNDAEFAARRAAFPQLQAGTRLTSARLGWAVRPRDRALLAQANHFLAGANADGTLQRLTAFYGQGNTFNTLGVKNFRRDMQERLPQYRRQFEQQAVRQQMDWRLLAAIGYQESKWDSKAVSPTGVTGLMMLTEGTAEDMGITNRRNPGQSIQAGAAYYRQTADRLPASVHEPDRTWMALAAYNMGPAHVLKARELAARAGDDPDQWLDVSRHLRQLPRAGQALVYVQEVRRYYDALLLTTPQDGRMASVDRKWVVTR